MPLVPLTLETQILKLVKDLSKRTDNPEQAQIDFAKELTAAITLYIKTATVVTPSGPGTIT